MNKRELIEALAEKNQWSKAESGQAIDALIAIVSDTVAGGEKVTLPGFGTFEKRERAARQARNPQTGATIKLKKTSVPAFKPGTGFKSYVGMSKKDQAAYRRQRG